jgi:hypothetical protein
MDTIDKIYKIKKLFAPVGFEILFILLILSMV